MMHPAYTDGTKTGDRLCGTDRYAYASRHVTVDAAWHATWPVFISRGGDRGALRRTL